MPDLPNRIHDAMDTYRVPPELVCLEITESGFMDDPLRALQTLTRLSALGIKLSVDDYGTGYSSLAYLKKLPVDEMKIDQAFVRNMVTDNDDLVIVRSTIELGHNLGLKVVAEGVEDKATLDKLEPRQPGRRAMREFNDGFQRWCLRDNLSITIRPVLAATRARFTRAHKRTPNHDEDVVEQHAPRIFIKTIHRRLRKDDSLIDVT